MWVPLRTSAFYDVYGVSPGSTIGADLDTVRPVVDDGHLELLADEYDSEHIEIAWNALGRMQAIVDETRTLTKQARRAGEKSVTSLPDLIVGCWETGETPSAAHRRDRRVGAGRSRPAGTPLRESVSECHRTRFRGQSDDVRRLR